VSATRTTSKSRASKRPSESDLGFHWGVVNTLLLATGLVVLLGGYVALSRGSITLAPVMLVLGYCVLIPASLLVRGRSPSAGE